MAKIKEPVTEPTTPTVDALAFKVAELEGTVLKLQQRVTQTELEKEQLEAELKRTLEDPFKSRAGYSAMLLRVYEMLWIAERKLGKGGTANTIGKFLPELKAEIGEAVVEAAEKKWRGV